MKIDFGPREPKEALAFWKDKAQLTPAEYAGLTQQARSRAFAVSGLAKRDQIATVYAALQAALENGETLAAFKKRLGPLLEQKGWTGQKAWRVNNIYRTNMQSAYQAGRYAQMKKTADARPFWRYMAVRDRRTRPTHLAMNGLVFRHDHEFWSTYYPPNGWQCRCTVQTLSQRQVDKRSLEVQTTVPRLVEPIDPVSGARLPARPLVAEPGWGGNVGQDWLQGLAPAELDDAVEIRSLATRAICKDGRGMFAVADGPYCKPDLSTLDKRHILPIQKGDILPANLSDMDYALEFLKEFGITDINGSLVHNIPTDFGEPIPVVISKMLLTKKKKAQQVLKTIKRGRGPYMKLLARTIKNPYEAWWVPTIVSGRYYDTIRLIRLFSGEGTDTGGFAVFNLVGPRTWTGATVFQPEKDILKALDDLRQGCLLYREP